MSATLGGGLGSRVQQLLAEAAGLEAEAEAEAAEGGFAAAGVPLVVSEGRCFPVTTKHLGRPDGKWDWTAGHMRDTAHENHL